MKRIWSLALPFILCGVVSSEYVLATVTYTPPPDGELPKQMVVSSSGLNVRTEPTHLSEIVVQLTEGTSVTVYEVSDNEWCRIDLGWVNCLYLENDK